MGMAWFLALIEPEQKAKPSDPVTDEPYARLGRCRSNASPSLRPRPGRRGSLDLVDTDPGAFFQVQKAHQAHLIIGAFSQSRSPGTALLEMNEISFALVDKWRCSILVSGSGKEDFFKHA